MKNLAGWLRLYYPISGPGQGKGRRVVELDFLRGIAILAVLLSHYPMFPAFSAGWAGVDLFFVLSGFLVGGLLIAEYNQFGRVDVGRFLIRRGLKIYPAFYFFLFLSVGITLAARLAGIPLFSVEINARTLVAEIFYLQNYLGGIWFPNWTLAVEEHFYFLLALFFLAFGRSAGAVRRLAAVTLAVIPVIIALRFLSVEAGPDAQRTGALLVTHLRLDSLLFGVLMACAYHSARRWFDGVRTWVWAVLAVSGAVTAIIWLWAVPVQAFAMTTIGYTVLYLSFGVALTGLVQLGGRGGNGLWTRYFRESAPVLAIANVGVYSYSIYLWHLFVLESLYAVVNTINGGNIFLPYAWRYLGVYLLLSVGLGFVMAKLVEYPVLRWRNRRFPSRRDKILHQQPGSGIGKSW